MNFNFKIPTDRPITHRDYDYSLFYILNQQPGNLPIDRKLLGFMEEFKAAKEAIYEIHERRIMLISELQQMPTKSKGIIKPQGHIAVVSFNHQNRNIDEYSVISDLTQSINEFIYAIDYLPVQIYSKRTAENLRQQELIRTVDPIIKYRQSVYEHNCFW